MIPVLHPIAEPPEFEVQCRKKGKAWLLKNSTGRPCDFWSPFRLNLADGFVDRCGYGGMYIASGTVDHFISCDEDRNSAYEWTNYRYLDNWVNSSKSSKLSTDLLDPFEVGQGWFEVILPSLQLVITDAVPPEYRDRAENTLRLLPIVHDERIVRGRREWLRMYESNEIDLVGLRRKAPLIAAAVEKLAARKEGERLDA